MNSDVGDYTGHHTLPHRLSHQANRSTGANSPPLPPPPPPEHEEHPQFGRPQQSSGAIMPIVPDEEDLPGWVPKNYIEKGDILFLREYKILVKFFDKLFIFFCI